MQASVGCTTNDRVISSHKRYRQANARKGNLTFRVRWCVTVGRSHPERLLSPRFPSKLRPCLRDQEQQSPNPQKWKENGGSGSKGVREHRKLREAQFLLRLTKVTAFPTKVFVEPTLPPFGVAAPGRESGIRSDTRRIPD
jgi:hypothetical protein